MKTPWMTGVGIRVWEALAGRVMGAAKGSARGMVRTASNPNQKSNVIID
jgi:hypothetical protein